MPNRQDQLAVERTALKAVRSLSLDQKIRPDETRIDPWRVADEAGVEIILRPLETLLGAYMNDETPGILLNSQRPTGQIQMTCAHELGHHFLGHGTSTDETLDYGNNAGTIELEADAFAYHLLMPNWLLSRTLDDRKLDSQKMSNPLEIYQLSLRLGVSYLALINQLSKRRVIQPDSARALRKIRPIAIKKQLAGNTLPIDSYSDVWLLTKEDEGKILCPKAGDAFVIGSPSHAAAGFSWALNAPQEFNFELALGGSANGESATEREHIGGASNLRSAIISDYPQSQNDAANLQLVEKRQWLQHDELARFLSINLLYKQSATGLAQHSIQRRFASVASQ